MFVATKASALRKNAENSFQSVTFQKRTKKNPSANNPVEDYKIPNKTPEKYEVADMKKLRYEIIKFGASGFSGELKENANIALMVSLGAEPPKNSNKNYKEMLEEKKKQKKNTEIDDKYKAFQSKLKRKPQQNLKRKRKKKDVKGLLDVYGEVKKCMKGRKKGR